MNILIYTNHWLPGGIRSYSEQLFLGLRSISGDMGFSVELKMLRPKNGRIKTSPLMSFPYLSSEEVGLETYSYFNELYPKYQIMHSVSFSDAESNLTVGDTLGSGVRNECGLWFGEFCPTCLHTYYLHRQRQLDRSVLTRPYLNYADGSFSRVGYSIPCELYPMDTTSVFVANSSKTHEFGIATRIFEWDVKFNSMFCVLLKDLKLDPKGLFICSAYETTTWGLWLKHKHPDALWGGLALSQDRIGQCRFLLTPEFGYSLLEAWRYGAIPVVHESELGRPITRDGIEVFQLTEGQNCLTLKSYESGEYFSSYEFMVQNGLSCLEFFDREFSAYWHLDQWSCMTKKSRIKYKRIIHDL